jgi:ATP-dependent Clp protease ATP-binding subunit ClpB
MDKLTSKAQEALQEAQQKAFQMNHQAIEPVHLLWALAVQPEGVVGPTLEKMNIPPDRVAFEAEKALQGLPQVSGQADQYGSPNLNRLLLMAAEEAKNFKDDFVSTEHLLLAISKLKGDAAKERLTRSSAAMKKSVASFRSWRAERRTTLS